MTARVIQGSFLGGQPKLSGVPPKLILPPIQAKAVVRPPSLSARAFAVRASGPPVPAFASRPAVVQRHGTAFAIEAGALGLASGGGKPLPEAVRVKMEAALRADFSNVRVHVGPQAERIGAIAFTVGSDIYFAPGRYQPDTLQGQQLLGHELTHVVQQRAGRVRNPLSTGLAVVQDHALEAEADRLGQRAAAHRVAAQAKMRSRAARPAMLRISPPINGGPLQKPLIASASHPPVRRARIDIRAFPVVTQRAVQRAGARRPVSGPGVAPTDIRRGMVLQMVGPDGQSLRLHAQKWHGWSKHATEWFGNESGIRSEPAFNTMVSKVFDRLSTTDWKDGTYGNKSAEITWYPEQDGMELGHEFYVIKLAWSPAGAGGLVTFFLKNTGPLKASQTSTTQSQQGYWQQHYPQYPQTPQQPQYPHYAQHPQYQQYAQQPQYQQYAQQPQYPHYAQQPQYQQYAQQPQYPHYAQQPQYQQYAQQPQYQQYAQQPQQSQQQPSGGSPIPQAVTVAAQALVNGTLTPGSGKTVTPGQRSIAREGGVFLFQFVNEVSYSDGRGPFLEWYQAEIDDQGNVIYCKLLD
jgi:Domain of unknown function (DUF4157)